MELNPKLSYNKDQIKQQYIQLIKIYHPDISKNNQKFLDIK